jgi:hypothetical protein
MNKVYLAETLIFLALTLVSGWYLTFATSVLIFFGMEGADFFWYAVAWSIFIFNAYMLYNTVRRWISR